LIAVCIYVAEAVFTVVRSSGVFNLPYHVNGYFELAIISLFIYALLLKREYIKQTGSHKPPMVHASGLAARTVSRPAKKRASPKRRAVKKRASKRKPAKRKPAKRKPAKKKSKSRKPKRKKSRKRR